MNSKLPGVILLTFSCLFVCFSNGRIDPGEGKVKVNFDDMIAETSFGNVQLRRLSTKSAVLPTDHALSTQWFWYWLGDGNSWREYGYEPLVSLYSYMYMYKFRSRVGI